MKKTKATIVPAAHECPQSNTSSINNIIAKTWPTLSTETISLPKKAANGRLFNTFSDYR